MDWPGWLREFLLCLSSLIEGIDIEHHNQCPACCQMAADRSRKGGRWEPEVDERGGNECVDAIRQICMYVSLDRHTSFPYRRSRIRWFHLRRRGRLQGAPKVCG
jgi:hypothetical protein